MERIRKIGLILFLFGLVVFTGSIMFGEYKLTQEVLEKTITGKTGKGIEHLELVTPELNHMIGKTYTSNFSFVSDFKVVVNQINENFKQKQEWDNIIWTDYTFSLTKNASIGVFVDNQNLLFFLSIILGIIGALLYIIPQYKLASQPGIKNNNIFHESSTNRGIIGIILGVYLIIFYIFLYWFPMYIVNWVILVDPISMALSGKPASQWFLYGFLYTVVMIIMGVRMLIKYRHSRYQIIRTCSVVFFQIIFAFLIPEILIKLNQPYFDFKNMWPLDYDFFFEWHIEGLVQSGSLGLFMLVWGIALFVIGVPVLVFFFGKRWYCSWVCGCGGLAETLGDPFRQLSNKSLKAWKIERWLIHGVLVFAVVMTSITLINFFSNGELLGNYTGNVQKIYGFLIGSAFAGVVGTGFYPLMGNRVWCRFGCPLAAYLGLVQRFKSRFRITTNGGQCISCGNCSTYCEMGIDVRWYAQRGQNIVRSSCVGCGICSAVCPRGVLNLENLSNSGSDRTSIPEVILGRKN